MSPSPADRSPERAPLSFGLSPLQRRLRVATALLLLAASGMIVFAVYHPFFHFPHPIHPTPQLRHEMARRALFVLAYWTVCFLLVLAMLVVAWLDLREVRRRLAERRLDILSALASRTNRHDPPSEEQ
jgi:hypothetical protein